MLTHFEWISCEVVSLPKKTLLSIVIIFRILSVVRTFQTFLTYPFISKSLMTLYLYKHILIIQYTYIITCNPKDINMCLDSNRTKIYYGHFSWGEGGGGKGILCRKCSKPSVIIKPVI